MKNREFKMQNGVTWVARPESSKGVVRAPWLGSSNHALRGLRACHPCHPNVFHFGFFIFHFSFSPFVSRLWYGLWSLALLSTAGCGGGEPTAYPVSGVVT